MAGVFPVPVKSSGRKQWTLYNGGKGIKRLGSPLIDDWCPDSQVVLAKKLLDEKCDLDVDQEENARLGVYWLIKASEQGHAEATSLLRHCLETGQGISEHNYVDVRACLEMPQEEKLARCAAKKVFESMSAGEDFITSDQLQDRMLRLDERKGRKEQNPEEEQQPSTSRSDDTTDWKNRNEGVEKLTEDMLVSAASNYSKGELPLVTVTLSLQPARTKPNILRAVLLHPLRMVVSSYSQIVYSLGRHSIWWYMPLSFGQLKVVVTVLFLLSIGLDLFIAMLPSVLYYISLGIMVVATCQALTKKQDMRHFRRWSNLFLAYSEGNVNAGRAEYEYCRNNMRPYIWFFAALLLNLLLYPVLHQTIALSELSVLAFGLTCLTIYNFTISSCRSIDWLALFSFAVHVLAKYPYDSDAVVSQGWRFLDVHVPTFASYVVGSGVEFCLNFRALFYLVIPAVLVKMAARDGWRGCYESLVPHCVALTWWQIAVTASEGATWYGLIRSALALSGLVLFLPLAGLATVLLPLAAAGKFFTESGEVMRLGTSSMLALVPIVISFYLGKLKSLRTSLAFILGWIQVLLAVVAALILIWPALDAEESSEVGNIPSSLTWEQFQDFCTQRGSSVLQAQLRCSQIIGAPVHWEGKVAAVRVVRVNNHLANIVNRLPLSLKSALTCFLGEPHRHCDGQQFCSPQPGLPPSMFNKCHLGNWNRYEMEVDVQMSTGTSRLWQNGDSYITLSADHTFFNFTRSIQPGDRVWFAGLLAGDEFGILTRAHPYLNLINVGCLNCHDTSIEAARKTQLLTAFTLRDVYSGIRTVLNFLFNPLVIFR